MSLLNEKQVKTFQQAQASVPSGPFNIGQRSKFVRQSSPLCSHKNLMWIRKYFIFKCCWWSGLVSPPPPLLSEAFGSRGVWAAVRDADGRVRPPLFVETKWTEEESLAFLTGSDLTPLEKYLMKEKTGCNITHHQTHRAIHDVANPSRPWICAGPVDQSWPWLTLYSD